MIAVGGLGQMVLRGIGRLDVGLAAVGGLGIVMLAVVLDRLTQTLSEQKREPGAIWKQGPIGFAAIYGPRDRAGAGRAAAHGALTLAGGLRQANHLENTTWRLQQGERREKTQHCDR